MPRDIAYNQAQATVVVNGLLVDNLADGDSIRIINDAVGAQKTVGTHCTMISFASDESGAFELDLLPISRALTLLYSQWRGQKTGFAVPLINITVSTGVGEISQLTGCAIENIGDISTGGPVGQMRTVRFVASKIIQPF